MLAIIGGTGLSQLSGFSQQRGKRVKTSFQNTAVAVTLVNSEQGEFLFLPRHGKTHKLPPHLVNYRANLQALKHLGATSLIAVNAVGGIGADLGPGVFCVPDQIIDYTWGREQTFFSGGPSGVRHVDFTQPYDEAMRYLLLQAAARVNGGSDSQTMVVNGGVYGCTQGPRLETAAEIRRLQRDGCHMVGMTGMPEAGLARELELPYACIALSVNWAAGLDDAPLDLQAMEVVVQQGMDFISRLIRECVALVAADHRV